MAGQPRKTWVDKPTTCSTTCEGGFSALAVLKWKTHGRLTSEKMDSTLLSTLSSPSKFFITLSLTASWQKFALSSVSFGMFLFCWIFMLQPLLSWAETPVDSDDGLPHALEHLVFFGSKSQPKKGYLDQYSRSRLCSDVNAHTNHDNTW